MPLPKAPHPAFQPLPAQRRQSNFGRFARCPVPPQARQTTLPSGFSTLVESARGLDGLFTFGELGERATANRSVPLTALRSAWVARGASCRQQGVAAPQREQ